MSLVYEQIGLSDASKQLRIIMCALNIRKLYCGVYLVS